MSANERKFRGVKLAPIIPTSYAKATVLEQLFQGDDERALAELEGRENLSADGDSYSCKTNIFLGVFFDGTRNNYQMAEKTGEQSNVARLYDIFPGRGVRGVLDYAEWKKLDPTFSSYFRVYVPGVGSPFPQVNDSGAGLMKTLGAAMGYWGEQRIVWALIQAVNAVHTYFYKQPLLSPQEATSFATALRLSADARKVMTASSVPKMERKNRDIVEARIEFEKLLRRLHKNVSRHWKKDDCPPAKIDPGIVENIFVSIFGFSRGATEARAFANWLDSLCQLDAMLCGKVGRSLGGFKVEFDFIGLFDTVASIGRGNTLGNTWLFEGSNGHEAWADTEDSLRIPACVKRCIHLVSPHELRRSFPCDSIAVGDALPKGASEVVFPGVHSDVGGGYAPMQQGKGLDPNGSDMLSRIPLIYMYKYARLAGVPLKLEKADNVIQRKFAVSEKTISDFNAYIAKCTVKEKSLTEIVREQALFQMAWRYARRESGPAPLHKVASYVRAKNFDKNDLHSANREFNSELEEFLESIKDRGAKRPAKQPIGFKNSVDSEWEEIARFWPLRQPDPEVMHFFDEYVHDARSAFKLWGEETEAEAIEVLKKWSMRLKAAKQQYARSKSLYLRWSVPGPPNYGLTANMRIAAEDYDRTKKLPLYINEGREPYMAANAGYFRFRKIYGGADAVLLSDAPRATGVEPMLLASEEHIIQKGEEQTQSKAA